MKSKMRNIITGLVVLFAANAFSQTDLIGKWELYKIVTLPADTQLVKTDDPRYQTYNFNYNNTFTSYHRKENEEATGKWGFDSQKNAIKIKAHTFIKSKTGMGDYNIELLQPINKTVFIQVIYNKKDKPVEYHIYRKA
jgi:hypothetical protein